MKIACFWGEGRSLDRISFRHEHLIAGFAALGHPASLVTARSLLGGFAGPSTPVDDLAELERPGFWSALGADVAVGVTWLRKTPILAAIAAAGVPRVAIADSDGQLGYAAHPRLAWERIAPYQPSALSRLRAAHYFAKRWTASRSGVDPEERDFVESARASTAIAFGGGPAIAAFRRFLARHGAEELAERAFVAPFPVPAEFLAAPVPAKEERFVAVGRWSDPQKNAPLLAAALAAYYEQGGRGAVDVFGADSRSAFGALAAREPRLRLHGVREPAEIRAALLAARFLVVSSRWETGPHAAGEALACGATLVSTPLPNTEEMVEGGRFGTLAANASPSALAAALRAEAEAWETGRRDGAAIAAHWRARLSPEAFCRALLDGLERGLA